MLLEQGVLWVCILGREFNQLATALDIVVITLFVGASVYEFDAYPRIVVSA